MDCKLCYADCKNDPAQELSTDQWKSFIDELVSENFLHIFLKVANPLTVPISKTFWRTSIAGFMSLFARMRSGSMRRARNV